MIDQAKAIQAKIENLVNDLITLNGEVEKIENRDKVSLELEIKLAEKSKTLSRQEIKHKKSIEQVKKDRDEISEYSSRIAKKEQENQKKEEEIKREYRKLDELKKELAKRESEIIDLEERDASLKEEKELFEIVKSKYEKDIQKDRERKLLLDERERKISAKEELVRKRLNA